MMEKGGDIDTFNLLTKNSRLKGFWLVKHKHANIPTMMDGAVSPSSAMVLMEEHTPPPGSLFARGWTRPP
jgi:hypothetical protein